MMTRTSERGAHRQSRSRPTIESEYFRRRDFEYAQPLYDLGFLLEVAALAAGSEVPKYRTFSLWRAGLSMDGYGTVIDRWLDGRLSDADVDYVPSSRIRQYLSQVRDTGSLSELQAYSEERYRRALRLRSIRGLGPSKIAFTLSTASLEEDWFNELAIDLALDGSRIADLYAADNIGPWQPAHVVPPLLRLLHSIESAAPTLDLRWHIHGILDAFVPITESIKVCVDAPLMSLEQPLTAALNADKLFNRVSPRVEDSIRHQLGWTFTLHSSCPEAVIHDTVSGLALRLDPLSSPLDTSIKSDLHLHTTWSDGNAAVEAMAHAVVGSGLEFFAVTDHSRSSKVQGGLTPPLWLRQSSAFAIAQPACPVLHGIEVDILRNGSLDLPYSLLEAADLVVASVHSSWKTDPRQNTDRLLRAIESGHIDVLAHPTSALIGKPGVPDYVRPAADVYWAEVFETCARWRVAVELNCFPSRLDLPLSLLQDAANAGCAISLGSDSHSRSHLIHLRYGGAALRRVKAEMVMNHLSAKELRSWIAASRRARHGLSRRRSEIIQTSLHFDGDLARDLPPILARTAPPVAVPIGSKVVGIDLTAGDKPTGIAVLTGTVVSTCSVRSDEEILQLVAEEKPLVVSIDSPLGLPGGGETIRRSAGIVRVAEHDLASIGIPAYPALIDSMEKLTLRGIQLRRELEARGTRVIESYPGAAQDILCLPRKQKGLELLRQGLSRLGLSGPGLLTRSHDEMDAITAAIVGRFHEAGKFEPMGIPSEAQLIVPKASPLTFDAAPVVCLAGKTGAGKSVVARYLSVFYGFTWIKTRDIIQELLMEDIRQPKDLRWLKRDIDEVNISGKDLRDFGAIVLNQLKQEPLRNRVTANVNRALTPVVVDSIRDLTDVDHKALGHRPYAIWFVDCSDATIRKRLSRRLKFGQKRLATASPVDKTADQIKAHVNVVLSNDSSLEELRWHIDDVLFSQLTLEASRTIDA